MNLLETLSRMANRNEIGPVLNEFGLIGNAAEIGVLWGGFTEIVLHKWKGKTWWAVDCWERQPHDVYREKTDDMDYEQCYRQVQELANKDKRIIVTKGFSHRVGSIVPDDSLDFCFIDANHAYNCVMTDMETWFPKVKRGGVFAGHDYCHNTEWPNFCQVQPAVNDWMRANNMDFVTDNAEGNGKSWWSVK